MKSKIKKLMEKNKNEIIIMLPAFINQLLLLMNSGATVTEAFCRIAESYEKLDASRQNYFTVQICNIYESSEKNGENVLNILQFCTLLQCKGACEGCRNP